MNKTYLTPNGLSSKGQLMFAISLAVLFLSRPAMAQTNLTQSGSGQTNAPAYHLRGPTDFQRLQYYYTAYTGSPAPGTEHGIFTLRPDHTWTGDWNSHVVPKPTRAQLDAITSQQVDVFRRAAVFTNATWQIVTSQTNISLSSLKLSASSYGQIRAEADRAQKLRQNRPSDQPLGATPVAPSP